MSPRAEASELVLLTTQAMRARRHPGVVALLWAWQSALAVLVAWPAASLALATYGDGTAGDGALWASGSRGLLDFVTRNGPGLRAVAGDALAVLLFAAVVGLVPMAATLTALAHATRDRRSVGLAPALGEGLRLFPAMALLLAVASVAQGLTLGFGAAAGAVVEAWVHASLGEARAQQLEGLVLLSFLGLASVIGVAHDLARVAVVRFQVRGWRGVLLGARVLRIAPLSACWSWAWRGAASLLPVVAAAWVTGHLGGRTGTPLVAVFVLHQAVVVSRVALRTSWLACALRTVDTTLRRAF